MSVDELIEAATVAEFGFVASLYMHHMVAPMPTSSAGFAKLLGITVDEWHRSAAVVLPLLLQCIAEHENER
jgi:hypothetical protein